MVPLMRRRDSVADLSRGHWARRWYFQGHHAAVSCPAPRTLASHRPYSMPLLKGSSSPPLCPSRPAQYRASSDTACSCRRKYRVFSHALRIVPVDPHSAAESGSSSDCTFCIWLGLQRAYWWKWAMSGQLVRLFSIQHSKATVIMSQHTGKPPSWLKVSPVGSFEAYPSMTLVVV